MTTDREKYRATLRTQQQARELSTTPIPYRITTALDSRGLDGPEVDRACGVEEPAVDQWETGELIPTREQIALLAKLTDYPTSFFYRPIEDGERTTAFMCSRSGPKGLRCQTVELGPPAPAEPLAEVIPLTQPAQHLGTGWRCRVPDCPEAHHHPAKTAQAAGAGWRRHYLENHYQAPAPTGRPGRKP
uniref:helix-turn-helix domain-containing protein n=1 Tax=Streptosporangium sp. CA-235898 TaxID=3240073 RepID=UPI003F4933FE